MLDRQHAVTLVYGLPFSILLYNLNIQMKLILKNQICTFEAHNIWPFFDFCFKFSTGLLLVINVLLMIVTNSIIAIENVSLNKNYRRSDLWFYVFLH